MKGRQTATAYCTNPVCEHATGLDVHYTGDTWTEPGWWGPEECPKCGNELRDERVDTENIVAGLIDELQGAGLLSLTAVVDEAALLAAIQAELRRQARERFAARYELLTRTEAQLRASTESDRRAFAMGVPF